MIRLGSLFVVVALVSSSLVVSTIAHADEDHGANTFVDGNPYQIAARCFAAGMYYPHVWGRSDEDRALMEIMDKDPHLNAELRISHFGFRTSVFSQELD
jgi:hypothetical protein